MINKLNNNNIFNILASLISFDTSNANNLRYIISYIENFCKNLNVKVNSIENNSAIIIEPEYLDKNNVEVLFSGHLDVVAVAKQNWTTDPFKAVMLDDKIFGRGTCDMKGFNACVLANLEYFLEQKLNFVIIFTTDEETNCKTILKACEFVKENYKNIKLAIVGEPTNMKICNKNKGCVDIEIEAIGKSCHSSNPQAGINAIDICYEIMKFTKQIVSKTNDLDLTNNFGLISGGTSINTVPNICTMGFDLRSYNIDSLNNIYKQIDSFIENLKINFNYTVNINKVCEILPLNMKLKNFNINGILAGGTEAGFYQNLCKIPTILCGCGNMQQAHKENEYIEIKQLNICDVFLKKIKHIDLI